MIRKFKSKIDRTLLGFWMGILLFGLICQLGGMFFVEDISKYTLGLWIGIILAMAAAFHIWYVLAVNLEVNAGNVKAGSAASMRGSLLRYGGILIVFAIICNTDFAYPLATFLGVLGLKIGAYLAPLMLKFISFCEEVSI